MKPASITQVRKSKDGRMVGIEQDLLDVIAQIKELDDRLSVKWSVSGEYFAVYERTPQGRDELVLTTTELDQQVVDRLRFISSKHYDYVKEMDRMDKVADKESTRKLEQETGEIGERLAHALRRDLQHKGKAFVEKDVSNGNPARNVR